MKKILLSLFLAVSLNSYAQEIKSTFIPHITDEEYLAGTWGQDEKGGFICYGTLSKNIKFGGLGAASFNCKGQKVIIADHVKNKINKEYLGVNFLYYNPTIYRDRGYTISPDITGIIVYYK